MEVAKQNLLTLKRTFDEHGLTFWLIFGTALGAYREGQFISYDRDTDVAIFLNDADKLFDITDSLISEGLIPIRMFTEIWPKSTGEICGISYAREGDYIDVCFFKVKNGKYWCLTHWAELHQFDQLDTIRFLGEEFKIPSDTENYFVDRYGEDWRTPTVGRSAVT